MKSLQPLRGYFRVLIISSGLLVFILAASHLPQSRIDIRFLFLATMTVGSGSLVIRIPRINCRITVSDTLIFLAMLLYGGHAAILVAALGGLSSTLHVSRKPITVLFNFGVMGTSIFITVSVLNLFFGSVFENGLPQLSRPFAVTLCVMALVHYFVNSGLVSIDQSLKTNSPLLDTWKTHYLWTSVSYFVGALAAGVVARLMVVFGFLPIVLTTPVIVIVYLTYQTYMKSVATSAAQAEQAQNHVEQQKLYISELEVIKMELHESREHFRNAALHDMLTGLPNRALLLDRLKEAMARSKREPGHVFAVLFMDLDRFKIVNDSLGHLAGDRLLTVTAARLKEFVRHSDTVARLGGDEFAILLDDIDSGANVLRIANSLLKEVSKPIKIDTEEVSTTASIGIALGSNGYDNPEDILRDADAAMYEAKNNGKGRYELFEHEMHEHAVRLLKLGTDLRQAIKRQELFVCYQPIVRLADLKIVGFEALIRWRHPELGIIAPNQFIPLAEEIGLTREIGRWILSEACHRVQAWHEQTFDKCFISINLSASQFNDSSLAGEIEQILSESGLSPSYLHLEITESVVMDSVERALVTLNQLRALGIHISIDDFGTGYSSLSYLHRFPINELKIDRSFITNIEAGDENLEIVRTIITLAGNLGMNVIAEGVETEQQRRVLEWLNCGYAQGYLFSPPAKGEWMNTRMLEEPSNNFEQYSSSSEIAMPDCGLIATPVVTEVLN